ncbi:unnamed protein product [Kluyveromyces dobzhanskii CBS 2104]|uniref:WGS project CCBQ000000000 data, contig 00015 n=1 Tax=Kluyveromyces dobzhanskii CBS 2104 TaxID=1427455 RepID=A0A0A8LBG7_9SACH|nr:unnamed protein product [Kluyveromyces dobzhanskii CBS 2104]
MSETLDLSHSEWIFDPYMAQDGGQPGELQSEKFQSQSQMLHHSEKSVRELVISKQHSRVFPVDNRLIGRMEDQLVRWKRPASSHLGTMQAIEGTHPYQLEPISMAQTWSQIRDAFSMRMQRDHTSDREEEADSDDLDFRDEERGCDTVGSGVRNEYNAATSVTANAVPVTLKLPARTDDMTVNSQYTYHYPIPQYYLPHSQQQMNQRGQGSNDPPLSCCSWLFFIH